MSLQFVCEINALTLLEHGFANCALQVPEVFRGAGRERGIARLLNAHWLQRDTLFHLTGERLLCLRQGDESQPQSAELQREEEDSQSAGPWGSLSLEGGCSAGRLDTQDGS